MPVVCVHYDKEHLEYMSAETASACGRVEKLEDACGQRREQLGSKHGNTHIPPPHAHSFVLGPAVINTHIMMM
jgi:hypothetical protein